MLRPRHRAFVITFATSASLVACGQGDGESASPNDGATNDGEVALEPNGCPVHEPKDGGPCSVTVPECDYEFGSYTAGSSCCVGHQYQCRSGQWAEVNCPCNPPAPVCPPTEPWPGSPCSTGSWGSCVYPDSCKDVPDGGSGFDSLRCAGVWTLDDNYVPRCPSSTPSVGGSCVCGLHHYGTCSYLFACDGGTTTLTATCDPSGAWTVSAPSCGGDAGSAAGDASPSDADADAD
jgi:hypothetical protein